jgi:alkylation response protein AidB-like acyl-CoA dehydrogenase
MKFTPQQEMIRTLARKFSEKELAPLAAEVDETGIFPKELWNKIAKTGFLGIKAPREYGGQGADCVSYAIVMEEISKAMGVAGSMVSGPNSLVSAPFIMEGTSEQKEKYLRPSLKGEIIISFALTEPGAGSDAGNLATVAAEEGDSYILKGRKTFISFAPIADVALVFAKTDRELGTRGITSFIVEMDQPGVSRGKPEKKMGIRGCPVGDIILDDVRVPKSRILGEINNGYTLAMKALDLGRVGVSAQALGIAQGALEEAIRYAKNRRQFGRPISKFQGISFYLAEMQTKVAASRLMVYEAASMIDTGQPTALMAAMTKLYVCESAVEVVNKALQIHGGYGFIQEYPVERMYRDIRILPIYEGTSEIQKLVIAKSILK